MGEGRTVSIPTKGRLGTSPRLLVTPLRAAVTLAQRKAPARPVAEYLHLDVSRRVYAALNKDSGVPEIPLCETHDVSKRGSQCRLIGTALESDAATAGSRLEHHRISDSGCCRHRTVGVWQQASTSHRSWHACRRGKPACYMLKAEAPQLLWSWADKRDASRDHRLGKLCAL